MVRVQRQDILVGVERGSGAMHVLQGQAFQEMGLYVVGLQCQGAFEIGQRRRIVHGVSAHVQLVPGESQLIPGVALLRINVQRGPKGINGFFQAADANQGGALDRQHRFHSLAAFFHIGQQRQCFRRAFRVDQGDGQVDGEVQIGRLQLRSGAEGIDGVVPTAHGL